jgi:hypothetical protein
MPLPNLEKMVPYFQVTIPSTGNEVTFRPFLVKEEKLLLMALETNEEKAMLDAVLNVISACAMSPLKLDALSNFDLEYIFLQLRARSINEIVELSYKCHNKVSKADLKKTDVAADRQLPVPLLPCGNIVKVKINLDEVKVQFEPDHKRQIFLTDTLGVNMRYPNHKTKLPVGVPSVLETLQSIAACIESVFDSESVYTNFTVKEIQEWIEKLTQPQFLKIQQFFETMPVLAHDIDFQCPKCGYQETIRLEGLASFFA